MKYKIYIVYDDPRNRSIIYNHNYPSKFIEVAFNRADGCSIEQCQLLIDNNKSKNIVYTMLPYIYCGE